MSQSSDIQHFQHEYQGEAFPFTYQSKAVNLYLQADSNNKIYKVRFETELPRLKPALDNLSHFVKDKELDFLIEGLASEFKESNFEQDISLLHFKEALKEYGGDIKTQLPLEENDLICRCAKVDKNLLEVIYLKHQGKKAEVHKHTNASMICGSCESQLTDEFSDLSRKHKLYEGQSLVEWREKIQELIDQFIYFSPEEFQGASIQISELSLPYIKLDISNGPSNLTEGFAKKSLENYLGKELNQSLDIKVSLYNSASN